MKAHYLLGAAIALSLAACGKADTADPAADAPKPETVATTVAGTALTKQYMTGKWAMESDGSCKLAQDFKADGSVDGFYDSWKLEGSNMIVTVAGETMTIALEVIDSKHVKAVVNGKTDHLVRC